MRGLAKRLEALEAVGRESGWGPVLDGFSDADLHRLEAILERFGPAGPSEADLLGLTDDDASFLEGVIAAKRNATCEA